MDKGLAATMASAFIKIYKNKDIRKLLYYPVDDFDDDVLARPDVDDEVAAKYINKVPADYLIQTIIAKNNNDKSKEQKRGYLTVFAEDYDVMENPYASLISFRIEVYMPIRGFEEMQFRMNTITDMLREMFVQVQIDGSFGRLIQDRAYSLNPNIEGYVGFAMVFSGADVVNANR